MEEARRRTWIMEAISLSQYRPVSIRSRNMEVRLAETEADVDAAQALRYRVFYEEMSATPSAEIAAARRDFDAFDSFCDHLLVIDHERGAGLSNVVGTYRLIRREAAERKGGFYTSGEYDISKLVAYPGEILELGRSCVDAAYRNRPTMQMLWQGISAYVAYYDIELMFGCGSLPGTEVKKHAEILSYLYHYHLAPPALRPRALDPFYIDMNLMKSPKMGPDDAARVSMPPMMTPASLPPLIKGYLRLGGFVGDGAVIDQQFNTIDVCVIVKTDLIAEKYTRHYERAKREAGDP